MSFGKTFIANPDLMRRLREGAPLNKADKTTFYGRGVKGYTDLSRLVGSAVLQHSSTDRADFQRHRPSSEGHAAAGTPPPGGITMRLGVLLKAGHMATNMTIKGQVTVPKRVREALGLAPGDPVEFLVNDRGQVVVCKAGARPLRGRRRDRFDAVRGGAEVSWRTDELMALLRPAD